MKTDDLRQLQIEKGCSLQQAKDHIINQAMKRQLDEAETYPQLLKLMRKVLKLVIDKSFPPLR